MCTTQVHLSSSNSSRLRALIRSTLRLRQILEIKDDSNHKAARRADRDLFAVAQIIDVDFEAVAAWAGVVVDLKCGVEGHVLRSLVRMGVTKAGGK